MRAYMSCNCRQCRHVSSAVKAAHKRQAHRALRRAVKKALRNGAEAPACVATGYKA